MKFRKRPVEIDATQWFKNGDHPLDYADDHQAFEHGMMMALTPEERKAKDWEGNVVRRFRHPNLSGPRVCQQCNHTMHDHGWIDTLEGGHIVCPGDWIITGIQGEYYPCKPSIFDKTYEAV